MHEIELSSQTKKLPIMISCHLSSVKTYVWKDLDHFWESGNFLFAKMGDYSLGYRNIIGVSGNPL